MIKFGHIISEVGLDPKKYPRSSKIEVDLSDRKERKIGEEEFNFNGKLFEKNQKSKSKFIHMIDDCESEKKELPEQIYAKLTDNALILHFPYRATLILFLS